MSTSTSRKTPPSRKAAPDPAVPYRRVRARWSDDDLRRLLARSTLGVFVFGGAWLTFRSTWLLWPAAICAILLQVSATMVAARAAVASSMDDPDARHERTVRKAPVRPVPAAAPDAEEEDLLSLFARLLFPPAQREEEAAPSPETDSDEPVVLELPGVPVPLQDAGLHREFFRRVVEAEFAEPSPGLVWPDLGTLQGSLSTRLRLFGRHPATKAVPASEVSDAERSPQSPWQHLTAVEAIDYRRGDTLARLSHRAFAPLAYLELYARLDLEMGEREALEAEIGRQYTVGYGRMLTPPVVLAVAEPLRRRVGGLDAIALADEARLALRSTSSLRDAEQAREEWRARARTMRDQMGWPSEVMALVECLIDYWLVQRGAAADIERAEETARIEGVSLGAALARRDATETFHFAEAIQFVCGLTPRNADLPNGQPAAPMAADTVA